MIVECPGCQNRYDVSGRPPGTRARCRCGSVFELPHPKTSASQLACPQCGANVPPTAHSCEFCTAALLVKACPRCFARVFHGSKHCRDCGAKIDVPAAANEDGVASKRPCPRCETVLVARLVGDVLVDECPDCLGLWLDSAAVERLVRERRQASADAVLGMARRAEESAVEPQAGKMYLKCPDCEAMMNRVNFARRSGIIIDVCRSHGTWFDADELPRVVAFVMEGGMETAERRNIEAMREEVRREKARGSTEMTAIRMHERRRNVDLFSGLLGAIGRVLGD